MNNLARDLDNNLIWRESYLSAEGDINPDSEYAPNPNSELGDQPSPSPRPTAPASELAPSLEIESPTGDPIVDPLKPITEPSEDPSYEAPSGGGGFGSGGGGGGLPAEEEIIEEMARGDLENKILGVNPKLFYGLLAAAAVGTFIYFRTRK